MLLMLLACAAARLKSAAAVGEVGLLGDEGPSLIGLGQSCMARARARHLQYTQTSILSVNLQLNCVGMLGNV
jgi:hypothetical protein